MPDDNDFNLEDWWKEESLETFGDPGPGPGDPDPSDPPEQSFVDPSAWGDVGSIGFTSIIPEDEMEDVLAATFKKLQTIKIADEWFYVTRRCTCMDIHEYVTASEDLIYESKTSTKMKNGYIALPISEIYFHMLRAYARAREGKFVDAQILWTDIHENWLRHSSDYRKPFILLSLYLTSLCTDDWKQCMKYLKQFWSLVKFMDGTKRHAFGIWDEWTTCLIVSWFFMKHSADFRKVFCEDYLTQSSPFVFQKKSIILQNLNNSFIADVIPEAYYNKARELNSGLPEIEYKEKKIANL